MQVSEWMRRDVVVVAPTTPAAECRQLMRSCGIRQLPVAGEDGLLGCVHDTALQGEQPAMSAASDLMEPLFASAVPGEPLRDAVIRWTRWMEDAMFVVDRNHVVGVITEHDLCRRAVTELPPALTVRDVANPPCTIDSHATVSDARDQLRRHFIRHLVVTSQDRLYGVISRRDLVPGRRGDQPLFEVITGPVLWTCGWQDSLRDAAATMTRHQVGCLPVISDRDLGVVEAVVCRSDVVKAMLQAGLFGTSEVVS